MNNILCMILFLCITTVQGGVSKTIDTGFGTPIFIKKEPQKFMFLPTNGADQVLLYDINNTDKPYISITVPDHNNISAANSYGSCIALLCTSQPNDCSTLYAYDLKNPKEPLYKNSFGKYANAMAAYNNIIYISCPTGIIGNFMSGYVKKINFVTGYEEEQQSDVVFTSLTSYKRKKNQLTYVYSSSSKNQNLSFSSLVQVYPAGNKNQLITYPNKNFWLPAIVSKQGTLAFTIDLKKSDKNKALQEYLIQFAPVEKALYPDAMKDIFSTGLSDTYYYTDPNTPYHIVEGKGSKEDNFIVATRNTVYKRFVTNQKTINIYEGKSEQCPIQAIDSNKPYVAISSNGKTIIMPNVQ